MKEFLKIFFIILSVSNVVSAQFLKAGFRYEPALFFTESKNGSSTLLNTISGSFSIQLYLFSWINLEIRPGYIYGNGFNGWDLGMNIQMKLFSSDFFVLTGLHNHYNVANNSHNSGGNYDKTMLFKAFGMSYQYDHLLSFDVTYFWTSNKIFEYYFESDWLTYRKLENINMNGIIKIGIKVSFEVM